MGLSALIAAWVAGALGGAHCLAMCGGFVAAMAGAGRSMSSGAAPLVAARKLVLHQLAYNAGRIGTYTLLGVIVGSAGATALSAAHWLPLQRAMYAAANLFLLALAATIVWRRDGVVALQQAGAALFVRVLPVVRPLAAADSWAKRCALGMVWGLVPCGLTYSVLPIALFAGGSWQGGAVMLAFGIGTLPSLVAAGWLIERTAGWLSRPLVRWGAATLLAAFAAVGLWRALFATAALAHGPFCL